MSISSISNFFYSKLFSNESAYQTEAIQLFANDLAQSLYNRVQSWEKVITSWKTSLEAWKLIKESEIDFCTKPSNIYCEIESNDGLILETRPMWNSSRKTYDPEIREACFTTPYGYIDMKFRTNTGLHQFIDNLTRKFHKSDLIDYKDTRHSFTYSLNTVASFKPIYPCDQCGSKLQEEFGKNKYTRTQALAIYDRLRTHTNIDGQAIV